MEGGSQRDKARGAGMRARGFSWGAREGCELGRAGAALGVERLWGHAQEAGEEAEVRGEDEA